jgi:hypothetical protein
MRKDGRGYMRKDGGDYRWNDQRGYMRKDGRDYRWNDQRGYMRKYGRGYKRNNNGARVNGSDRRPNSIPG